MLFGGAPLNLVVRPYFTVMTESLQMILAAREDIPALTAMKSPEALHLDRIRDSDGIHLEYYVLKRNSSIIGFSNLVFIRPNSWPDYRDTTRLPQINDLNVVSPERRRGYGTWFIQQLVMRASIRGFTKLYLTVDPVDNKQAFNLYHRLGFVSLQDNAERRHWEFVDSSGIKHSGDEFAIDMVKAL
jgi:GNAT superfamily N-acetyltransferase